ncbi:MAG: hypothetical protein HOL61_09105 [Rhodospirillaceae bacterium]|nr:hypothetical protein [Rhodospirillaceae bacterium]
MKTVSDGTFAIRLVLALGGSLILAAALTALLATALNAINKLGYTVSSDVGSQITAYWYIAMFLLSAVALNKAYVPWQQLFARRSAIATPIQQQKLTSPHEAMCLKPKHRDSLDQKESKRAVFEMKTMRGDPDVTIEPIELDGADALNLPKEGQANEQASSIATPNENHDIPISKNTESKSSEPATDGSQPSAPNESESAQTRSKPPPTTALTEMDIEPLIMMRFLGDTVMTLRASHDQMDARTQFGVSLYLAGAASALADQRGLTPDSEHAVLSDALKLIGHGNAMRDSFFSAYNENMDAKKNQNVIEAGQQAMVRHLQFTNSPAKDIGTLLQKWHTAGHEPQPNFGDIFLLTYTNIPGTTPGGAAEDSMTKHNRSVRRVLANCGGEEVRHTGKGIFARFENPDDAICAAISIQQDQEHNRKSPEPLPPTRVALVASLINQSDPDFSGDVFSCCDDLCRRLGDGRIACDAMLSKSCTIKDVVFDRAIPSAHSGILEKGPAVEIIWDPLPA